VGIEPALVDSVLAGITSRTLLGDARASGGAEGDAAGADGAPHEHGVETPYLQLVIDRLWEATRAKGERLLTDATLTELGGPAEIVRGHLERAMEGLTPDDQDIAADSFRFLVTSSKTKVAQRVSDLADWTGHDVGDVSRVLERLSSGYRYRILRPLPPPPGEDSQRFELFHDVLADPVLAWRRRFRKDRDAEVLAKRIEQEDQKRLEEERVRHRRQVRRIRIAGAVVVAILAVGLGTALVFIYQQKAARSRTLASAAIGQVDRDPELALLLAREAWGEKHTGRAEEALRRALGASLVRRRIRTGGAVLGALPDPSGRAVLTLASDHLARWSIADGRQLGRPVRLGGELVSEDASADGGTAIAATTRATVIWPTASTRGPIRARGGAQFVTAGADGRYAAAVDPKRVRIWDTRRPQQPPVVVAQRGKAPVAALWLDPRGRKRFVGVNCGMGSAEVVNWGSGGRVRLEFGGGEPARRYSDRVTNGCNAALSPDGRLVATAVLSPIARIWDARTGDPRGEVRGDKKGILAFSWRPDSARLALAGGKEARIVDARQSPRVTRVLASARDWVLSTHWSADGGRLVTASNDGTATVFDMQTGNALFDLRGHGNSVNSAVFVGSTYKVVTGSTDGTVRLWDTDTGRALSKLGDWALDAAYSPKDGRVAIAATGGRRPSAPVAMIWDPVTGKHVGLNTFGVAQAQTVDFDTTGARLLVGGNDGSQRGAVMIVPAKGDSTPAPGTFRWPAQTARFSPDGRRIAVAMDYGLTVVELSKGAASQQNAKGLAKTQLGGLAFSRLGDLLVVGDANGALHVYDPSNLEQPKRVVKAHDSWVHSVAFSPDRWRAVTTSDDQTTRVWDIRDWHLIRQLPSGTGSAAAEFSHDGRMIVTAGADRSIRVWDTDTGKLIGIETPHADFVNSVEFSADDKSILSGSDDQSVKITPCPTCMPAGKLLSLATARSTRQLTPEERRTQLGD
jgi:WD40 repeat protein